MKLNVWRARLEVVGLVALAGTAAFLVATSWRKWPDPLIDFGEQLYSAWQLSQGAVLYRDVDLLYGPLSQYFNAVIFRIFGPGLIVLAITNLVIVAGISSSIYILFRQCWGVIAAWLSTLIFISVFAFSQFVDAGNYEYAAPYSHEVIHGTLVCLLLCLALVHWVDNPTRRRSFLVGLLFGLTVVLKPEFIVAGVLMMCVAFVARWRLRSVPQARALFAGAAGAILPTALFSCYFSRFIPWSQAISAASRAWLNALDRSLSSDPLQMRLLGLDQPWTNFVEHARAAMLAAGGILAVAIVIWLSEREWRPRLRLPAIGLITAGFVWLSCRVVDWRQIGRCLFALALAYSLFCIVSFFGRTRIQQNVVIVTGRALLGVLATTLMTRMILNGRIYHYGFYQAALAAALVPAVMIGELPIWLGGGWRARGAAALATLAIVLPGIAILANRSQHSLELKTLAIGSGRDRFYALPGRMEPIGEIINAVTGVLREKGEGRTLTVLPEGEFINYLARLPNPVPHAFFYAGATSNGREARIVKELERTPPYWIVIISRDLIGYGIERYGEKSGSGEEILRWVEQNYKQVGSIGGDPLDYRERGAIILRKYSR
jgi:hypothetical protein